MILSITEAKVSRTLNSKCSLERSPNTQACLFKTMQMGTPVQGLVTVGSGHMKSSLLLCAAWTGIRLQDY